MKNKYLILLYDIDSSTFGVDIRAYSFEDALIRVREMYRGYNIKSIEIKE